MHSHELLGTKREDMNVQQKNEWCWNVSFYTSAEGQYQTELRVYKLCFGDEWYSQWDSKCHYITQITYIYKTFSENLNIIFLIIDALKTSIEWVPFYVLERVKESSVTFRLSHSFHLKSLFILVSFSPMYMANTSIYSQEGPVEKIIVTQLSSSFQLGNWTCYK